MTRCTDQVGVTKQKAHTNKKQQSTTSSTTSLWLALLRNVSDKSRDIMLTSWPSQPIPWPPKPKAIPSAWKRRMVQPTETRSIYSQWLQFSTLILHIYTSHVLTSNEKGKQPATGTMCVHSLVTLHVHLSTEISREVLECTLCHNCTSSVRRMTITTWNNGL